MSWWAVSRSYQTVTAIPLSWSPRGLRRSVAAVRVLDPATEARGVDSDSAAWVRALGGGGGAREAAVSRLHTLLLRFAVGEARRRGGRIRLAGPELDDVAHQAAADALVAILAKLDRFRGDSRFTTWAYGFVALEVSMKIGRHPWAVPRVAFEAEDWDRLPGRVVLDPIAQAESRELAAALRRAMDEELTPHQRRIFLALVVHGVPLDTLVDRLGTSRTAVYKALFDARSRLRAHLETLGYLSRPQSLPTANVHAARGKAGRRSAANRLSGSTPTLPDSDARGES